MKKALFFSVLLCVFLLNTASTCCDDDAIAIVAVAKSPDSVRNILNQGTWGISYFFDAKINKTSSFLGYKFTFGANDTLIANGVSADYTGNWLVTRTGVTAEDSNTNIAISFSSPIAFVELAEQWNLVNITATQLRLRCVNSSSGETNYLTFEKN